MKKLMLFAEIMTCGVLTHAQVVQVKRVGTLPYAGTPSPEVKEKAYLKAQVVAVERYFAETAKRSRRTSKPSRTASSKISKNSF